jgi:hypothetical protein
MTKSGIYQAGCVLASATKNEAMMNLTFLAQDPEGNMRLLKRTTTSDTPDVDQEWKTAMALLREVSPDIEDWNLVGALAVTPDQRVRWYPDHEDVNPDDLAPGRVLH